MYTSEERTSKKAKTADNKILYEWAGVFDSHELFFYLVFVPYDVNHTPKVRFTKRFALREASAARYARSQETRKQLFPNETDRGSRLRVHNDDLQIPRPPCSRITTRMPHACTKYTEEKKYGENDQCCFLLRSKLKANPPRTSPALSVV